MIKAESKKFKAKSDYCRTFIFLFLFLTIGVFTSISITVTPEQKIVDIIMNQEVVGTVRHTRNVAIGKFIVSNFGKTGVLIFISIVMVGLANELYETISEYRRMIFREKLIREGLRAPDDYVDDYVRVPLWKKIVNLFSSKRKKSYPSEREMREALKKNKYYKGE